MKRFLIAGIIGIALVATACSSAGPGQGVEVPNSYTLQGTLTAPNCGGGYDLDNAAVTIRDEKDTLIGSTSTAAHMNSSGDCKATFTVVGLPKANFYQIKVGSHGGPSYSFAQMQAAKWRMDLTLG